jgi:hypothetical protein
MSAKNKDILRYDQNDRILYKIRVADADRQT